MPSLREAQIAQTEERIIAAAAELFLENGYVPTTLEAVAKRAQVGARTVYVRFGTKAALFKRVVDVAIVGDTQPTGVLDRDWAQAGMTAPTAAERIAASAAIGRQIMQRTGALFAVAQQAAAVEPLIAAFWQQGREQSRHAQEVFWTRMADDGLLDSQVDLAWLIDTASLLAAAETYLLITRMTNWDLNAYQNWLAATLTRLSRPITGNAPADLPGKLSCQRATASKPNPRRGHMRHSGQMDRAQAGPHGILSRGEDQSSRPQPQWKAAGMALQLQPVPECRLRAGVIAAEQPGVRANLSARVTPSAGEYE